MKLAIVIITYNIPAELLLLQVAAIRKFCKDDDYTIEIIDNSSNTDIAEHIRYHSLQLELNYHKTFSSSINSSDSHSFAANLSYQKLREYYTAFAYFDHDLIPVKEFSIKDILGSTHIAAGLGQGAKKKYFWPGCVIFDNKKIDGNIIDFSPNAEFGLDTGGNLYKLIEEYGEDRCIFFNETYHQNPNFRDARYGHYAMINNEMFMHFVNSSNWAGVTRNEERLNSLKSIAAELINNGKTT